MSKPEITVFGGTGFLGHRICEKLLLQGITVRVASRHPENFVYPIGATGRMVPVKTDIRDRKAVENAIDGASGVVNAVSLYVERGELTFDSIHVAAAGQVAEAAQRSGAERLIHLSGVGADAASSSPYVRSRAQGEERVRAAFENATVFRPCVMFGPGDALVSTLIQLADRLPVLPLFGDGHHKMQPVFVGDVAEAACTALSREEMPLHLYEFGGPDILTYRRLLETVLACTGKKRALLPVSEMIWEGLAGAGNLLPEPPLTEGQVALLKRDNVASADKPGLAALGVRPTRLEGVLAEMSRGKAKHSI